MSGVMEECSEKLLIYNNASGRANNLHMNSLFPRKPDEHRKKIVKLVNSFKRKSEECKLLLINGKKKN